MRARGALWGMLAAAGSALLAARLAAVTAVGAVTVMAMAGVLLQSAPGLGAPATVQLTAKEFQYEPHELTASAGDVTFVVKNNGAIEHNFVLEDQIKKKRADIPILEPAQTLEVKVALPPGTYAIYCSLPGHKEAGMIAALHVR